MCSIIINLNQQQNEKVFLFFCHNGHDTLFLRSRRRRYCLKGKTFVYEEGLPGSTDKRFMTKETYEFKKNGDVYHLLEVGTGKPFSTKDMSLYYKMDGNKFTIYHGNKGWEDEAINTVYRTGEYFTDYVIINGKKCLVKLEED